VTDHPTGNEVERFARGVLPRARAAEVLRHLLEGCSTCAKQIRAELVPAEEAEPSSGYDAPIARALAAVLSGRPRRRREELALVERGLELLRSRPQGVFGLTDEEAEELHGVPLVEVLLQLSFEERYRDPARMLSLALLAKTAAQNLDPQIYEPEVIADFQARALGELANAYRVNDELGQAEASLSAAERYRRQGTGNLLLLARLADLQASLFSSQRKLPDACELLDSVHRLYLKVGDDHLAGRALIKRGIYINYEGEPHRALQLLRQALPLLDRDRDPQLVTSATESILEVLVQSGEYREAARMLLESGLRQALADQPLSLVKLRWVEGQLLAGLGKLDRAEAALLEARAGFLQHNLGYRAAIIGLDLAAVWLEQGRHDQVEELARDMLATFRRLGIQREAVRALGYLDEACRRRRATPGLARHVGRFLRQLEREPQLRFEAL
jgi:tetratricopeptide (TPR) repeat protein